MVRYITKEGLEKWQKDLEQLIGVERPKITAEIAEARDKGDLSENAEYDAAKEAQGLLEARIAELQKKLSEVRVIDKSQIDTSKVGLLSCVKLKNTATNTALEYTIVPQGETDVQAGKIAIDTPIAKGLLGKKVGEVAEVTVPAGVLSFEVLEIGV